jgi:hypothetical protein
VQDIILGHCVTDGGFMNDCRTLKNKQRRWYDDWWMMKWVGYVSSDDDPGGSARLLGSTVRISLRA